MPDPAANAAPKSRKRSKRKTFWRETHGLTDVGLVREGNEDALLLLEDADLYVVADGMGGHACGEVASAFTIEAIRAFYESPDITQRVRAAAERTKGAKSNPSFHSLRLRKAVESANLSVFRLAQEHVQLRDMGTTVVAVAFAGSRIYVANVGDSRVYRMRDGELLQLTEDHSLLNEYIRLNLLQPHEIEDFPYKNVIVRALGLQDAVEVDITSTTVRPGDQILLCTDGLTDLVRDREIGRILQFAPTAADACEELTRRAKEMGGHDNITSLIIRIRTGPQQRAVSFIPPPPSVPAPGEAA
jgi:protein phosphatase